MGMSASQMRYCMISGKKSDVEYQGQQINQQRTTLATQSSTLNTQLLDMSVPTPPSTSDYSKTSYSFSLGSISCAVTGSKYDSTSGTYDVNYTYNTTGAEVKTGQSVYYRSTDATTGAPIYSTGLSASSVTTLTQVAAGDKDYATLSANLATIYGDDYDKTGETYFYSKAGDTYRFVTGSQLAAIDNNSSKTLKYSTVDEDATIKVSDKLKDAKVTWSDDGRMSAITVADPATGKDTVYTLSVTQNTDNSAYEDAYNEYEYKKGVYDQEMNKINAEICIIQSQDKKLELKLQNLDTQQQALSTEMDSVKKVIDKNIEASFKAFA